MPSNWKISVTELHHHLVINVGKLVFKVILVGTGVQLKLRKHPNAYIAEFLCLYAPWSCMLFVIGEDDDATSCAFSRGCCKVNGTAIKTVSEGLSHSRKYDFLCIVSGGLPHSRKYDFLCIVSGGLPEDPKILIWCAAFAL
jgi:hypothetical protein